MKLFFLLSIFFFSFTALSAPSGFFRIIECISEKPKAEVVLYTSNDEGDQSGLIVVEAQGAETQYSAMKYEITELEPEGLTISDNSFDLNYVQFDDGGDRSTININGIIVNINCKVK